MRKAARGGFNMKKSYVILVTIFTILLLSSCTERGSKDSSNSNQNLKAEENSIYIKPADLSNESTQMLKVLEGKIFYYDLITDKTIKSYILTLWNYNGDSWEEVLNSSGNLDKNHYRIGVSMVEKYFSFIIFDEDNKIVASDEFNRLQFKEGQVGNYYGHVDDTLEIKENQEITLLLKTSYDSLSFEITSDFRATNCKEGIAVTLTVATESIE